MILEPFLTVASAPALRNRSNGSPFLSSVRDHRAKATVLMRSLRVTDILVRPEPVRHLVAALAALCLGGESPEITSDG